MNYQVVSSTRTSNDIYDCNADKKGSKKKRTVIDRVGNGGKGKSKTQDI